MTLIELTNLELERLHTLYMNTGTKEDENRVLAMIEKIVEALTVSNLMVEQV